MVGRKKMPVSETALLGVETLLNDASENTGNALAVGADGEPHSQLQVGLHEMVLADVHVPYGCIGQCSTEPLPRVQGDVEILPLNQTQALKLVADTRVALRTIVWGESWVGRSPTLWQNASKTSPASPHSCFPFLFHPSLLSYQSYFLLLLTQKQKKKGTLQTEVEGWLVGSDTTR